MAGEIVDRWVAGWGNGPLLSKVKGDYTRKFFRVFTQERVQGFSMPYKIRFDRDYEGICKTKEEAILYLIGRGQLRLAGNEEARKELSSTVEKLEAILKEITEAR